MDRAGMFTDADLDEWKRRPPRRPQLKLAKALMAYCEKQREHSTPKERIILEDIRKIIQENT